MSAGAGALALAGLVALVLLRAFWWLVLGPAFRAFWRTLPAEIRRLRREEMRARGEDEFVA